MGEPVSLDPDKGRVGRIVGQAPDARIGRRTVLATSKHSAACGLHLGG
jgi:hypothetical protein